MNHDTTGGYALSAGPMMTGTLAPPPPPVATVGRQVHFWCASADGYKHIADSMQPHAATIAFVHPTSKYVNLHCIDHNGNPYTVMYVELRMPNASGVPDRHYVTGYATWPSLPGAAWPGVAAVVAAARERAGEVG
jgi:hypothetical protein